MLYIASALTPTPIIDTLHISSFTSTAASSLIVAKPDRVELWDVDKSGLIKRAELELWGNVISIARVTFDDSTPYILVLLSPPNAQLLLVTYDSVTKALIITSSLALTPPTPSLRQAEFFSSVISQKNVALVSLWTGVLVCAEIEVEKDKEAKKRRASVTGTAESGRLTFRDHFNINVREHNLLSMAFMPASSYQVEPVVSFLWQSSSKALLMQNRRVSLAAHSLVEASLAVNVVTPLRDMEITNEDEFDFNDIPYSCPAARLVLPVSQDQVVVIGDEHTVLYKLSEIPTSPRVSRMSFSSATGAATSPRASAVRRSPQNEMSAPGKRRKSSNTAGKLGSDSEKWEYKPIWRARQGFGTVLAASVLESHSSGASVIIGDESGHLTAFGWETEGHDSMGQQGSVRLSKVDLGIASAPSSLTYIDASHLFLASACGDSLLIKLQIPSGSSSSQSPSHSPSQAIPASKGKARARDNEEGVEWAVSVQDAKGGYEIRERWMNLAPLKDFCVVEDEAGAMSHLVAASGASSSNSLRTIRSGVGLEDIFTVQGFDEVTGLFPLRNIEHGYMLVSSSTSTYMIAFEPETAIVQLDQKLASLPTLAASMLNDQSFLHVNAQTVSIYAVAGQPTMVNSWQVSPNEEIVSASICEGLVVIAKKGGDIVVLQVEHKAVELVCIAKTVSEISAVTIISHKTLSSPIIAASTWTGEILLYSLDHLRTAEPVVTSLHETYYACSLFIRPSSASPTTSGVQLIAGLSDGTMVVYDLELSSEGGGVKSTGRKSSGLGSRPLKLFPVEEFAQGEETIIAVGISERMSVIFENKGRIDFSSVNKKDVTAATGTSLSQDGCLVFATPTGISFTEITSLKKLSIQTLDLENRSPMKIVSLPSHRLLGVGSVRRVMDSETGDIMQSSHFELRDPVSLELLVEMPLDTREQVTSLSPVFLNGRHYVAVGTSLFSEDENDEYSHGAGMIYAREGRLHLIEPKKEGSWQIGVKTTVETVGAVHDVTVIHGFLAVAAGSKVSIHKLDPIPFSLQEVSHFASAFIAQHLYVSPPSKTHEEDRLVVGDGMRSIFVLEVDVESGMIYGDQRDLATHQVMALEGVRDGGQSVIISDGHSNISTLRLNEHIEPAASFGLHEPIAQFRKGSLIPQSSAPDVLKPELLFGTVDGRLGIIGELTAGATKTLVDLQRNMDKYHKGPGGTDWRSWRRGGTELIKKETAGFIDGDFVQRFLDVKLLTPEEQKKVFEGTTTHERVTKLASGGKSVEAERADVAGILEAAAGFH